MSFCVKINSFDLNRKILPCFKRKQEKIPCHEHLICLKNCAFTIFFIIRKIWIFHELHIKLDSIGNDIIERVSTEYVMLSKLCAINLGLLNPAAHLIFKCSLLFNILSFFQLVWVVSRFPSFCIPCFRLGPNLRNFES